MSYNFLLQGIHPNPEIEPASSVSPALQDSLPSEPLGNPLLCTYLLGFPGGSVVKNPAAVQGPQERWLRSLGQEDPLEEGMATHSSIPAWRIPWTEEPGSLQSWAHMELNMTEAT